MGLLSQLLPAVREIRGALVGGYVWLLLGWLWFGAGVPNSATSSDNAVWVLLGRVYEELGTVGVIASLSVAAYLIGSVAGELVEIPTRRVHLRGQRLRDQLTLLEQGEGSNGQSGPAERAHGPLTRLLEPVDRLASEVEFRFHIALPVVLLAMPLSGISGWLSVGCVAAAGMLALHGAFMLRRVQQRLGVVEQNLQSVVLSWDDQRRQQRRAQIALSVHAESTGDDTNYSLRLANTGQSAARSVDVETDDDEPFPELVGDFLPIDELRPGESIDIPLAISMGSPPIRRVRVEWVDAEGPDASVANVQLVPPRST